MLKVLEPMGSAQEDAQSAGTDLLAQQGVLCSKKAERGRSSAIEFRDGADQSPRIEEHGS